MAVPASNLAPDYDARRLRWTPAISRLFGLTPDAFATHTPRERDAMLEATRLVQPMQCPTCRHREQRILAREHRVRRSRRRWAGRLIIASLVVVLGMLAWYRFGADPMASVQR